MDRGKSAADRWLADRFEEHRARLRAVAYRMLGSAADADDAVQETWIRFSRSDTSEVDNLGSWLTTVISRVCLTVLQSRRTHPTTPLPDPATEPAAGPAGDRPEEDPEREAVLGDTVGMALMVVLEALNPAERVAFVLHDVFAVPFEEIAPIVGRSAEATRQLASRARRRVQSREVEDGGARRSELVGAFLTAAREGDLTALLAVLDPDVVLRADARAVRLGAPPELRGARALVDSFAGRAGGAVSARVDGADHAVWAPGGRPRVVFYFTIEEDRITAIELVADPERLGRIDVVLEPGSDGPPRGGDPLDR